MSDSTLTMLLDVVPRMGKGLLRLQHEIRGHKEEKAQLTTKVTKLEAQLEAKVRMRVQTQLKDEDVIQCQDTELADLRQRIAAYEVQTASLLHDLHYFRTKWGPRKRSRLERMMRNDKHVTWEAGPASTSAVASPVLLRIIEDLDPEEEDEDGKG